ncbi:transcription termination/antitermination NusG family protein [Roseibium suaedae]|uniref:Transcription antitermination factor NusG n=1 Tax=Roseibium suaedae TaxID=735517 RepID=A0A1M7D6S7_9HYPH|nr:transcription termination/antitermination NusG family protein [Roseibium suaedae]SHL75241.1 Transcription antitermination factor NusG [Roseibium suaedae]
MADVESLIWFIAKTNPRCEGRAVKSLTHAGIETFCPMQTVRRKQWIKGKRRSKDVQKPLFTGYVFVGLDPDNMAFGVARRCDGIGSFVGISGAPLPVSGARVCDLMAAQDMGMFDHREGHNRIVFEVGEQVIIDGGWIDGEAATVTILPRKIGQDATVEVDGRKVRLPVEKLRKVA